MYTYIHTYKRQIDINIVHNWRKQMKVCFWGGGDLGVRAGARDRILLSELLEALILFFWGGGGQRDGMLIRELLEALFVNCLKR